MASKERSDICPQSEGLQVVGERSKISSCITHLRVTGADKQINLTALLFRLIYLSISEDIEAFKSCSKILDASRSRAHMGSVSTWVEVCHMLTLFRQQQYCFGGGGLSQQACNEL